MKNITVALLAVIFSSFSPNSALADILPGVYELSGNLEESSSAKPCHKPGLPYKLVLEVKYDKQSKQLTVNETQLTSDVTEDLQITDIDKLVVLQRLMVRGRQAIYRQLVIASNGKQLTATGYYVNYLSSTNDMLLDKPLCKNSLQLAGKVRGHRARPAN